MSVYLPKAAALGIEDVMGFLIAQNDDLQQPLWRVFTIKVEGKGKLFTIEVDDRSLQAIKRQNHSQSYRPQIWQNIPEGIDTERTALSREIDLLHSEEEKLNYLDLDCLALKVDNHIQESAISEEEGDIPTVEKSTKRILKYCWFKTLVVPGPNLWCACRKYPGKLALLFQKILRLHHP